MLIGRVRHNMSDEKLVEKQDPFVPEGRVEVGSLRGSRKTVWVEDSYAQYDSPSADVHDYVGVSLTRTLYAIFVLAVGTFFGFVLLRVGWLQVVHGAEYASVAEANRTRHIPVVAERGLMYDRHGVPFVHNTPRYALHIFPNEIPRDDSERAALADEIVTHLGVSLDEISVRLNELMYSFERDVLLYERLTQQQAIALAVAAVDEPALRVETGIKRTYDVFADDVLSLAHVIGFEGKISSEYVDEYVARGYAQNDYVGKQGVEAAYESDLRGVKGDRVIEVSSRGAQLSVLSERKPVQGSSVVLSIDVELQRAAEKALFDGLILSEKERGVVVVQATQTGEILALVSLPSFSNEAFARGISQGEFFDIMEDENRPLVNRAISGLYPSGSVIKPVMAVAALAEGIITPRTTIVSTGGLAIGPWFFPDWQAGGHGGVDVRGAIADSVNTFFYVIGGGEGDRQGLGVDRIYRWFRAFGFGDKTGFDVGQEQVGLVPHPDWKELRKGEQWYIGDTYNLSIGQGDLLVTPLQLTNAISAVANGGKLMVPFIVKQVGDRIVEPRVKAEVEAEEVVFETVQAGMRDAVVTGSARFLSDLGIMVAGKTGTAQWSTIAEPHAWFVGFAPYHQPEITVTVLVEEGEEGSRTAVPIAKNIFEWWHKHGYQVGE